jgi:hypothetical protein
LYDTIQFKGQGSFKNIDLQLGFSDCRVHHNALLESNSQSKLDRLRQLHTLDMTEHDIDRSKYYEEIGVDGNTSHNCLVEWNDIHKSQSWVNFFTLSLSNPIPIISFARHNEYLEKIPLCHLIPYCKPKPSTIVAKVQKASARPTFINYKFGIQVPRRIKNAIHLDKKNGNSLWEEAIKTELKRLQIIRHS